MQSTARTATTYKLRLLTRLVWCPLFRDFSKASLTKFFIALIFTSFFSFNVAAQVVGKVAAVFVLDQSGSVSTPNFLLQRDGFVSALSALPTNSDLSIAVIYFDSSTTTRIGLTVFNASGQAALASALTARTGSGGTATELALNAAKALLDGSSAKTKFIFLSTDGEPNNVGTATSSAALAKSAGIKLEPIGIGLTASGKNFLDSISSSPPTPNPGDFTTFGVVVKNKILAAIGSALNVSLSTNALDFGNVDSIESAAKSVKVLNNGATSISISSITISGRDKDSFLIKSASGAAVKTPIVIPPKSYIDVFISTKLLTPSQDGSYQAVATVVATDGTVVDSTGLTLTAKPGNLEVGVFDATAIVNKALPDGTLYVNSTLADEFKFNTFGAKTAIGLVADGNARLLLRVKTPVPGLIRYKITSGKTSSKLFVTNASSQGSTEVMQSTVKVDTAGQTPHQATIAVKAGIIFSGADQDLDSTFEVEICLLNTAQTACAQTQTVKIKEKRAPVLLMHGLWANNNSFTSEYSVSKLGFGTEVIEKQGLAQNLQEFNYKNTTMFSFDDGAGGAEGPTLMMKPDSQQLASKIEARCQTEKIAGYACTRAILIGHSMGGLMARKFIYDNKAYKTDFNFQQGGVAKLITLGTPYLGSPFANLLKPENALPCVNATLMNNTLKPLLAKAGNTISSAIVDLAVGSALLNTLNTVKQEVPAFAVFGDFGVNAVNTGKAYVDWVLNNIGGLVAASGCTANDVFGGSTTDGIVPTGSAVGGLSSANALRVSAAPHIGMGTNSDIAIAVRSNINLGEEKMSTFAGLIEPVSIKFAAAFRSVIKAVGNVALAALGVTNAYAAETLGLSVSNLNPAPGAVVTATASPSRIVDGTTTVLITDGKGIAKELVRPPYVWAFTLPQTASGTITLVASAFIQGTIVSSPPATIVITTDLTAVQSIRFVPDGAEFVHLRNPLPLQLIGQFSDGLNRQIPLGQSGIQILRNGLVVGTSVANVNPASGFIASEAGEFDVVAVINSKTTTIRVTAQEKPAYLQASSVIPTTPIATPSAPGAVTSNNSSGGGCTAGSTKYVDPMLYLLVMLAAFGLLRKRFDRS